MILPQPTPYAGMPDLGRGKLVNDEAADDAAAVLVEGMIDPEIPRATSLADAPAISAVAEEAP